ncbi:phage tail sheath C-terminal domain-containing protein [Bartonella rattaustraliani]|uniref:phage tail sheath C-terminal domain-containing protein n=1 Tax=Bartonella rattaustraliani TaxID=481139 RepID=UPI00031FD359|nr:phage tail sheath C-terminal domain-containing protein [Bartonella rattaustraliani]
MATEFNHGIRILEAGEEARPLAVFDQSAIGAVVTAPDADAKTYPLNEPVLVFTHEGDKIQKLGTRGTALDVIDAVCAQGIDAKVILVRVEEKSKISETQVEMVGSNAQLTGVHALAHARGHLGVEPGILLAPAYSAGRFENGKNPVAEALEQVAEKLQALAVFDTGGKNTEESLAYRADFSSRFCYLLDPFVRVASGDGGVSIKPASPFAAAMFLKRDKQRGGVFWSPSNQDVKGILGTARPISYFDGEIDHEANRLNQADIATFIPARLSQNGHGTMAANGRILWGNHTTSSDPLWRFVNVVRTRAALEKTIINHLRPFANDENLTGQHVIAITRSLTQFLDDMIARGALLGGRVWFDRDLNSNSTLQLGKLRVEFDAEEVPPLEDLSFGSRRNSVYFDRLAQDIQNKMTYQFGDTLNAYRKAARSEV